MSDFTDTHPDDDPELYAEQFLNTADPGEDGESEGLRKDRLIGIHIHAEDHAHRLRTMYVDLDAMVDSEIFPVGYLQPVREMKEQVTNMAKFYEEVAALAEQRLEDLRTDD